MFIEINDEIWLNSDHIMSLGPEGAKSSRISLSDGGFRMLKTDDYLKLKKILKIKASTKKYSYLTIDM